MKRLLRLTALALGLTLLLSACGHKNTEPERKDAATQTVPVEGITGLTLCALRRTRRAAGSGTTTPPSRWSRAPWTSCWRCPRRWTAARL